MATGWEAWESYFYPETYDPATQQGTLRNKFGERDAHRLDIRERAASAGMKAILIERYREGAQDLPALIRAAFDSGAERATLSVS